MPVNVGGLGSNIKFSDLQTFYGGEHPISLSEYYRGGGEVPSTVLSGNNPYTGTTNFPGSGSGSGSAHGINVTVTTTAGGPGALTVTNRFAGAAAIGFTTVRPDRIEFGTIRITADTSFARVQYVNGQSTTDAARGPAWVNGDSGLGLTAAQVAALPMRAVGAGVTGSGGNGASLVFASTGRATRGAATPDTHDITFTNDTGQRITFVDADTTGNPGTLDPGASAQVQNDGSSPDWEFEYNYVDAGSGSGTGDETNDGIVTDVTAVPGTTSTSVGALTTSSISTPNQFTITDPQNISYIRVGLGGRGNHIISQNGRQVYFSQADDQPDIVRYVRGPNYQVGDGGFTNQSLIIATISSSGNAGFTGFRGPVEVGRRTVTTTTSPTTYNVSYRNTNTDAVVLSGSTTPVGAGQTLAAASTQGGTDGGMVSTTGLSSPNWSFQYRYAPSSQPANTEIPEMGTTRLNRFNAPGNAAP